MSGIVCAVRGGPGSHHTRRAGLARSAAADTPLYLLVIIPAESYDVLHDGEQRAIRAEMAWRELALARATASQLGRPNAQFNVKVRIGDLRSTIAEFAADVGADTVLLGTPRSAMDATLSATDLETLAADLRDQLGAVVDIIRPEGATAS